MSKGFEQEKAEHVAAGERFRDSAFPVTLQLPYESRPGLVYQATSKGLSKREIFAAMAMQGILPNYRCERSQEGDEAIAYLSVKMADALLAELAKAPGAP